MSLIDEIERLGALAATGDLAATDAAHLLQQYSDGGLTYVGAQSVIEEYRTVRADYMRGFRTAREHLAMLDDPPTT